MEYASGLAVPEKLYTRGVAVIKRRLRMGIFSFNRVNVKGASTLPAVRCASSKKAASSVISDRSSAKPRISEL
jgi:hypothetical protein